MLIDVVNYFDKDAVREAAVAYTKTIVGSQCLLAEDNPEYPTLYDRVLHPEYHTTFADFNTLPCVRDYISVRYDGTILGLFHVQYRRNKFGDIEAVNLYTHRYAEHSITFARDMRRFYDEVFSIADTVTMVAVRETAFDQGLIGPGDVTVYPTMRKDGVITQVSGDYQSLGGTRNVLEYYNGVFKYEYPLLCRDGVQRPGHLWFFITPKGERKGYVY